MLVAALAATVVAAPDFALQFNGYQNARISDCAALDLTNEITIEAWVKLSPEVQNRTFGMIVSKNYAGSGYELTVLDRPNRRLHAGDFTGGGHNDKPSLPIGEWTHVAYARSLKQAKLYVNGELKTVRPTGISFTTNDLPLCIGGSTLIDQEGKPCAFIGLIDDVRVWSVARSQMNIKRSMRRPPKGNEEKLVAWFALNEGSGQVIPNPTGKTGPMMLGESREPDGQDPVWVKGN